MVQIYLTASTGGLYYRVKQGSVWLNWFKITGTAVQQ